VSCEWAFSERRSQEFSSFLSLNGTKFIAESSLHVILTPSNEDEQSSRGGEREGEVYMRQRVDGEELGRVLPVAGGRRE